MVELRTNLTIGKTKLKNGLEVQLFEIVDLKEREKAEILERLSDNLFNKKNIPTAGLLEDDDSYLALATTQRLPQSLEIGYDLTYIAKKRKDTYQLNPKYHHHRRTIKNLINRLVRDYLINSCEDVWLRNKKQRVFCSKTPLKLDGENLPEDVKEKYEVYRCFKFRIDVFSDGRIGLTTDPQTTVLDKKNLFELYNDLPKEDFESLLESDGKFGSYMILHNCYGNRRLVFVDDIKKEKSVSDKLINSDFGKKSISDIFNGVNPVTKEPLEDDEPLAVWKPYSKADKTKFAPMSCVKYLYDNEKLSKQHKPITNKLIMDTKERIKLTQRFSKLIEQIDWDNSNYKIRFSNQFSSDEQFENGRFKLPLLEFGKGSLTHGDISERKKWHYIKKEKLEKYDSYKKANINRVLVIRPKEMNRSLVKEYYSDVKHFASVWSEELPSTFYQIRTKDYIDLLDKLEKIQEKYDAALIIFRKYDSEIYNRIKGKLNIPSQGVLLDTIKSKEKLKARERLDIYENKIINLVSGLIGKCGGIPWILSEPLSSDCFIGVDSGGASSRIWSYAYVFDKFGEYAGAEKGKAHKGEGIKKNKFKNSIISALSEIRRDFKPNKIVVHRDGEIVSTEKKGLREAINQLIENDKLSSDLEFATVNIKKNVPYRIFERENGGLEDCSLGSYFVLEKDKCLIDTTGKRTVSQGTSQPLLLEVDSLKGDFSIKEVAKDILYLSELNWGSPGKDVKLPITVRFAESMIELADKDIDFAGTFPV